MIRLDLQWPDGAVSWVDERGHWFAALCLAALTLALYHHTLSGWWGYDDLLHLKEAILHSPAEYFFIPRIWQEFMAAFFTPLLTLSYDFDYTLFGLNPAPFYAHQLISIALAAFTFYLLLTLWMPRSFALFGAALLLVSSPFALASAWLAVRHYIEGLALASFALYLWVEGLRRQKPSYHWGSAALYLLAMLAKEVYVPLAALLVLVPEGTWRERLRASWLHWLVLAVFLLWRFWMLGGQFGGYGVFETNLANRPDMVLVAVLLMPTTFFIKLFGASWALPVWMGIWGAAITSWILRAPARRISLAVAVLVLVSIPLVPVVGNLYLDFAPNDRLIIIPVVALVFILALGLGGVASGRKGRALALVLLAAVGSGLWQQSHSRLETWHSPAILKQEGKFLLERSPMIDVLVVSNQDTSSLYRGIHWLRAHVGNGDAPATVTGGYFGLEPSYDIRPMAWRFYRHELQCDCFQEVTESVLRERAQFVQRMVERPLRVNVEWGRGWLSWSLGPYLKGRYFLLAGQRPGFYSSRRDVGRQGSLAYLMEGFMRVGYESPEGWVTLSPEFHVNLAEPGRFEWHETERGAAQ